MKKWLQNTAAIALPVLVLIGTSGCATSTPRQPAYWQPPPEWFAAPADVSRRLKAPSGQVITLHGSRVANLHSARERISQAAGFKFDLVIVDSKEINAFAFRKDSVNKIGFTVGYLENFGDSADVLAVTMGHEVAHHLLSHVDGRRAERDKTVEGSAQVLATIANQIVPFSGLLVGTTVRAIGRSYSRDEERAADETGLRLADLAGFDVCKAKKFWENMKKSQLEELAKGFLSTHPGGDERIGNLDEFMQKTHGKICG